MLFSCNVQNRPKSCPQAHFIMFVEGRGTRSCIRVHGSGALAIFYRFFVPAGTENYKLYHKSAQPQNEMNNLRMQSSGTILLSCMRYAYDIALDPTAAESDACLLLTTGDPLGVSSYFSVITLGMPVGGSL